MKKINNIGDVEEGDYILSKHKGLPCHVFVITYKSNSRFIRYKLVKSLKQEDVERLVRRIKNSTSLYKLDAADLLAYIM